MSTLFEKVISQSKEVTTLHEPYTNEYYFGPHRKSERYGSLKHKNYSGGKNEIERHLGEKILFVKELAFQGEAYISDDELFTYNHSLMIRHPSKVFNSLVQLKSDFTEDEFGFRALKRIHERIKKVKGISPIVVDGDIFRKTPEKTIRHYSSHFGLSYSPSLLQWEDGAVRKWADHEQQSQSVWHSTLENSQGIIAEETSSAIDIPQSILGMFNTALEIYHELTPPRF